MAHFLNISISKWAITMRHHQKYHYSAYSKKYTCHFEQEIRYGPIALHSWQHQVLWISILVKQSPSFDIYCAEFSTIYLEITKLIYNSWKVKENKLKPKSHFHIFTWLKKSQVCNQSVYMFMWVLAVIVTTFLKLDTWNLACVSQISQFRSMPSFIMFHVL